MLQKFTKLVNKMPETEKKKSYKEKVRQTQRSLSNMTSTRERRGSRCLFIYKVNQLSLVKTGNPNNRTRPSCSNSSNPAADFGEILLAGRLAEDTNPVYHAA